MNSSFEFQVSSWASRQQSEQEYLIRELQTRNSKPETAKPMAVQFRDYYEVLGVLTNGDRG